MGCNQSSEKKEEDQQQEFDDPIYSKNRNESAHRDDPPEIYEEPDEDNENVPVAGVHSGRYKSCGPTNPTDGSPIGAADADVFECFKDGLLYRLVKEDQWLFYNDTVEFEMHVTWRFGPRSKLTPGPTVEVTRDDANWYVCKLVIYPSETAELFSGKYDGYKSSMSCKPLSDEYRSKKNAEAHRKVRNEMKNIEGLAGAGADPERVLNSCVLQKTRFVDLEFPPVDTSLSRPGLDRRSLPSQAWKRPTDYLPASEHELIRVFKKVEPGDIDQGQLGDCWFLCSVASLAEFPAKIKDIFRHPVSAARGRDEAQVGAYHVTINKHGWWHVLVVDDYFPVVGDRPCYAKCEEDAGELWVSLIEKAYAKVHGSYSSITAGDALHALQDLTGYPINRFDTEWDGALKTKEGSDELFGDLERYDRAGYLINLNTPGEDNSAYMGAIQNGNSKNFEEKYKRAGLGMGHAYSVLKVKEFPDFPGGPLKLLQIRNPWGNGTEWTGAWCDSDPSWQKHPQVAEACEFVNAEDGTFWMEWEAVKEYFDGGGVCFLKNDWFDYRVKGAFVHGFPNLCLEVTVTKKVEAFVIISQKDKRGLHPDDEDAQYKALMLSVSRGCGGQSGTRQRVHLNSSSDADQPREQYMFNYARDLALLYTFEPSDQPYVVIPRIYDASASKDYTLGLITDTKVGDGLSIRFKTLDKKTKVFHNYPKFEFNDSNATPFETQWQYNPEVGCPITKQGTEVEV